MFYWGDCEGFLLLPHPPCSGLHVSSHAWMKCRISLNLHVAGALSHLPSSSKLVSVSLSHLGYTNRLLNFSFIFLRKVRSDGIKAVFPNFSQVMALRENESIYITPQWTDEAVWVQKELAGGGEGSGDEEFQQLRSCPSRLDCVDLYHHTLSTQHSICPRKAAFKCVHVSTAPLGT